MSLKRTKSRLEHMRQITKPAKVEDYIKAVWMLVDVHSGRTIGVYDDEDLAWEYAEAMWDWYRIETDVEPIELNKDVCLAFDSPSERNG